MKITITKTDDFQVVRGVETRRWEGVTERGVRCHVFVACVSVIAADADEFERELYEIVPPEKGRLDHHLDEVEGKP